MASVLYARIKDLCQRKGTSIARLEAELGFGNASISKWNENRSPSVDKIMKIAHYFGVTTDYLLGLTDIECSVSDIMQDEGIISIQRARQRMSDEDKIRMTKILNTCFESAFAPENNEGD